MLLGVGVDDPFINPLDVQSFARLADKKRLDAEAVVLPKAIEGDSIPFVHTNTTEEANSHYMSKVKDLFRQSIRAKENQLRFKRIMNRIKHSIRRS